MPTRMLIDARHREETRVAVVKGNRIEEFDFESAEHKQLKGNIYLAKVTRVEPSLQAAFVDYGGNRHGFLAFSEIHPDYYQIPREDREALLREEAEHAAEEERLREAEGDFEPIDGHHDDDGEDNRPDADIESDLSGEGEAEGEGEGAAPRPETVSGDEPHGEDQKAASQARAKRMSLRRRYKIQDVIRRRQVLLVQVVKEERGNKGAALTTYLSLAGRYCVLMPNTSHGGGISRKISNGADRKRLKSIISDLALPPSMGCIVRTAGLQRTKTEIKRDFDYLARLWDEIREKTLKASAPAAIHTDSDLIKRAIRDIYNREIDEVLVEGEDGYRAAKDFMKLLMPSHAKKVQHYADPVSLFQRYGVEDQLAAMYNPTVQLKSGGYLVINPTEALVSIDINSGRSTREHGIEQTAVATNLEAAREIARQLRLRDMAGLVVIDFIDMESNSNIRKVEKAMKDALKDDRARIQVGRISGFGLMEMSRQRLRTGVLEASTRMCPHCEGTGLVRTASSAGLSALRLIEEEASRGRATRIVLRASQEATIYVLNNKRGEIAEIEDRYGVRVEIIPDGETEGARMTLEASGPPPANAPRFERVIDMDDDVADDEDEFEGEDDHSDDRDERDDSGRKRRRRRRRKSRRDDREGEAGYDRSSDDAGDDDVAESRVVTPDDGEDAEDMPRRRRGRRGGRRRRDREAQDALPPLEAAEMAQAETDMIEEGAPVVSGEAEPDTTVPAAETIDAPKTRRRPRAKKAAEATVSEAAAAPVEADAKTETKPKPKRASRAKKAAVSDESADTGAAEPAEKPKPKRASRAKKAAPVAEPAPAEAAAMAAEPQPAVAAPAEAAPEDTGPPRKGWWQRTFG